MRGARRTPPPIQAQMTLWSPPRFPAQGAHSPLGLFRRRGGGARGGSLSRSSAGPTCIVQKGVGEFFSPMISPGRRSSVSVGLPGPLELVSAQTARIRRYLGRPPGLIQSEWRGGPCDRPTPEIGSHIIGLGPGTIPLVLGDLGTLAVRTLTSCSETHPPRAALRSSPLVPRRSRSEGAVGKKRAARGSSGIVPGQRRLVRREAARALLRDGGC